MVEDFNIDFVSLEKNLDKFCSKHKKSFSGDSCPECDKEMQSHIPGTKHPDDCQCEKCKGYEIDTTFPY